MSRLVRAGHRKGNPWVSCPDVSDPDPSDDICCPPDTIGTACGCCNIGETCNPTSEQCESPDGPPTDWNPDGGGGPDDGGDTDDRDRICNSNDVPGGAAVCDDRCLICITSGVDWACQYCCDCVCRPEGFDFCDARIGI